jgi:hypothetical protein
MFGVQISGLPSLVKSTLSQGSSCRNEGFAEQIAGSAMGLDDIRGRSYDGWYLSATQALELGLVAGLV